MDPSVHRAVVWLSGIYQLRMGVVLLQKVERFEGGRGKQGRIAGNRFQEVDSNRL